MLSIRAFCVTLSFAQEKIIQFNSIGKFFYCTITVGESSVSPRRHPIEATHRMMYCMHLE